MENPNFEDLLLAGAIEVHGVDEKTGEFLYTFTNKMKDILPELYKEHIQQIHNEIMYFWEHGAVNLSDMDTDNPVVSLAKKAYDKDFLSTLSTEKLTSLNELKRILRVV
jgi:hypothetical protein